MVNRPWKRNQKGVVSLSCCDALHSILETDVRWYAVGQGTLQAPRVIQFSMEELTRGVSRAIKRFAQFIVATRGRKVDCLASCTDQTCCSISSILRRCAGR